MRQLSIKTYFQIKASMDGSDDITKDVATEVVSELFDPKYVTDEERVTGILEAIKFVTEVEVS